MLVIAVGNSYRSDDGAGPELAARVRALHLPGVSVIEALGDVGLIDTWTGYGDVIVLDAVQSGAAPGTVIRLDVTRAPLPRQWFRLSSHQVGVADAVELARALHKLPPSLVFVGIEGKRFDEGQRLSPEVSAALDEAAALVAAESRHAAARRGRQAARRSNPV